MPSSGKVKTKSHLSSVSYLVLAGSECCPMCQEQIKTLRTFGCYRLNPSSGIILIDGVYSWKTKRQLFSYLVLAGRVLPNGSVAPNRNKLPHYVHVSGTCCTHLLALYWLMVFIHETHVMPSSGKVKTKRHLFSYFVIAGSECCPMRQLLQTGTNYHITYFWLLQFPPILWLYIDSWCLFMKHMWCHLVAK